MFISNIIHKLVVIINTGFNESLYMTSEHTQHMTTSLCTSPSRRAKFETLLNHVHPDVSRFRILIKTNINKSNPIVKIIRKLLICLIFI